MAITFSITPQPSHTHTYTQEFAPSRAELWACYPSKDSLDNEKDESLWCVSEGGSLKSNQEYTCLITRHINVPLTTHTHTHSSQCYICMDGQESPDDVLVAPCDCKV
jgi:hypothetical protein